VKIFTNLRVQRKSFFPASGIWSKTLCPGGSNLCGSRLELSLGAECPVECDSPCSPSQRPGTNQSEPFDPCSLNYGLIYLSGFIGDGVDVVVLVPEADGTHRGRDVELLVVKQQKRQVVIFVGTSVARVNNHSTRLKIIKANLC